MANLAVKPTVTACGEGKVTAELRAVALDETRTEQQMLYRISLGGNSDEFAPAYVGGAW